MAKNRQTALDRAMIWLMAVVWCSQALIHDFSMERRPINANLALASVQSETLTQPRSHTNTWPAPFLSTLIQPSLLLSSTCPSPSQKHLHSLLALSLPLYTLRFFSLLSLPGVTLSHVSITSSNTRFASDTSRRLPTKSWCAKGQALKPT